MNRVYRKLEYTGLLDNLRARNELYHFGILGMKWGVRRYQNKDGSLTSAGRKRYGYGSVTVDPHIKDKPGYVRLTKKGYERALDIKEDVFREYERIGHKEAVELLAEYMGMDYDSVVRIADHNRGNAKRASKIIDDYMDQKLSTIIDNINKEFELDMNPKDESYTPKDESYTTKREAESASDNNSTPGGHVKLPNIEKDKYADTSKHNFTTSSAMKKAYDDLDKLVPNFDKLDQDEQDRLWMEYMNESGLYKYV